MAGLYGAAGEVRGGAFSAARLDDKARRHTEEVSTDASALEPLRAWPPSRKIGKSLAYWRARFGSSGASGAVAT